MILGLALGYIAGYEALGGHALMIGAVVYVYIRIMSICTSVQGNRFRDCSTVYGHRTFEAACIVQRLSVTILMSNPDFAGESNRRWSYYRDVSSRNGPSLQLIGT